MIIVAAFSTFAQARSTIKLGIGPNCSGTIISKQGHLLTALHCFTSTQFEKVQTNSTQVGTGAVQTIPQSTSIGARVHIQANAGVMSADVIFSGAGSFQKDPDLKSVSQDDYATIRNSLDDFIILKLPVAESFECSRISNRPLKPNELLFHVGFPYEDDQAGATGPSQQVGVHKSSPYDLPNLRVVQDFWEKILDPIRYSFSTARIVKGYSGGGVFNQAGELAGVNSLGTLTEGRAAPGSAFVAITHIYSRVEKVLGPAQAAEIFNCTN